MADKRMKGHLAALFCAFVWGTTFISTKVLLREFSAVDILFYRFLLGYLMLWIVCPKRFKPEKLSHELYFPAAVTVPVYLFNFLFLGICACTLCFAVWSYAVDTLGAVVSSNYIYAVPVITVVTSAIVLKEPITPMGMAGMALTIVGLVISAR